MVARLSQLSEAQKPKGELVYARDIYGTNEARLSWKFNVYATNPLSNHYIYVDAENGKILLADAIIKHADKINAAVEAAKAQKDAENCAPTTLHTEGVLSQHLHAAPPVVSSSVLGSAQTRYAGTRAIYTTQTVVPLTGTPDPNNASVQLTYSGVDPRSPVTNATIYTLKDDTRGGGIETYDMGWCGWHARIFTRFACEFIGFC